MYVSDSASVARFATTRTHLTDFWRNAVILHSDSVLFNIERSARTKRKSGKDKGGTDLSQQSCSIPTMGTVLKEITEVRSQQRARSSQSSRDHTGSAIKVAGHANHHRLVHVYDKRVRIRFSGIEATHHVQLLLASLFDAIGFRTVMIQADRLRGDCGSFGSGVVRPATGEMRG